MPLRKCIALYLVMAVHLASVIAQSDLRFTGRKKKSGFFQMRWFLTLPLISLLPLLTVTERKTWLPPASVTVRCAQCFQREITLQVPKENHCKGKVRFNT